jgi:hypothetical protein
MIKQIFKLTSLSCLISASFMVSAGAVDLRKTYEAEKVISSWPEYTVKSVNNALLPSVEVVVFYQPSYASTVGEYNVYERSANFVATLNEAMAAHGLNDYSVVIKDVVPVESVPDSAPYNDVVEDGVVVTDGAEYLFSLAALNEFRLVDGEFVKNPEFEIYQNKWQADLVLYLREQRDDDKHLGLAGIGGEYASAVDIGGDSTLQTTVAHEIGHNFGLNHEEGKASVGPDYARAWECSGKQTIMYSASAQSTTLRHFSDPNLSNNGVACGDEAKAYNAKVLVDNYVTTSQRRSGVEALGSVSFKDASYSGNESDGVSLTLVRTGDVTEAATVKVFAKNGDAIWGEDFTDAFVLAEFAQGESQASVVYPFVNDGVVEDLEKLTMQLNYPYKLSLGSTAVAEVNLLDGDSLGAGGTASIFGPDELVEGEEITLTVTRAGGIGEVVINVSTSSENAQAGTDFIPLNENIVFKEGEVEKQVVMTTPSNDVAEINKAVTVTISSPNAGVIYENSTHIVTLVDDDAQGAGTFNIIQGAASVSESAGAYPVTISRSGGFAETTLNVSSVIKGAEATSTVQFAQNEVEKTVTIAIPNNSTVESDYEMKITLSSNDVGATVDTSTITVTIKDDDTPAVESGGESSGGSFGFIALLLGASTLLGRRRGK